MIVYITQSNKTELSRMTVEGLPLWHLTAGSGFFARKKALHLLEELYRSGVRRCICGEERLSALAEKVDITQYSVLPLRTALLEDLLALRQVREECILLRCGGGGEETARAVLPVLARRARYVRIAAPDPAPLERELLYRWGISAGETGCAAAVTVLCGDAPEAPPDGPAVWLTPDCGKRQRLCWISPRAAEISVPASEALAAALIAAGKWQLSDIHITDLLDIQPENHYNAT